MNNLGLRALLKNISFTMVRQLSTMLVGLITQIAIARFYGPDGSGIIAVALLLPSTLAAFLNLGISPANVYFVASSQVSFRKAWHTTVRLGWVISLAGVAIGATVIELIPQWFPGVPSLALWLALTTFPFSLFVGLISGLFQAQQDFKMFNSLGFLNSIFQFVLVITFVHLRLHNPSWILLAMLLSSIVVLVVSLFALQSRFNANTDSFPSSYKWKALSYGYKSHLSNILAFINYKADVFIVNILLGPSSAGLYVISVIIAEKLWILSNATSTIIFPRLSQLSNNPALRDDLTPLLCRWIFVSTALGAAFIAFIAPTVIPMLYSNRFQASVNPLIILLPGIVAGSASRILANDIAARGKPELNMITSIIVVFTNIFANILLIPSYGIVGAAAATTIAYCLNLTLRLWMYSKFNSISPMHSLLIRPSDIRLLRTLFIKPIST